MNAKSKNKSGNTSNTDKKRKSIAESKTPRTTMASRPPSTLAPTEDLDPTISTERLSEESLEATPRTHRTMSGSGDLTGLSGRTVSSSEAAMELIAAGQDREASCWKQSRIRGMPSRGLSNLIANRENDHRVTKTGIEFRLALRVSATRD